MKDTEAAWLAGILDGEGFIGVVCAKRGRGSEKRYYKPTIIVSMTHEETISRIVELVGGRVYKKPRPKDRPNSKQAYDWHCPKSVMSEFLCAIQPYSVTKRKSIDLLLLFLMLSEMNTRDAEQETSVAEELRALTRTCRQFQISASA